MTLQPFLWQKCQSSDNLEIAYLVPEVVDAIDEMISGKVLKILVSTDVASEGLNLQEFNIVVNYDVSWSPVRREQRIGRVYRLRQRRNCAVIYFVRDTSVEYAFYTKLVYKLLNIVEQRLALRPIEGILELYIARIGPRDEEYLAISEKTIGLALVELYERHYGGREPIDTVLSRAYLELLKKLQAYKELVEELASRLKAEMIRDLVEDFKGCVNHEEFTTVITSLLEVFFNEKTLDPARVIRELYEKTCKTRVEPVNMLLIVKDPDFEEGYLGVVDFMLDGKVRYSLPLLFVKERGKPQLH